MNHGENQAKQIEFLPIIFGSNQKYFMFVSGTPYKGPSPLKGYPLAIIILHGDSYKISDLCLSNWQSLETAFQLTNMLNHIAPANYTAGTAWVKRLHIDLDTKV
jgi:hypothetical protein